MLQENQNMELVLIEDLGYFYPNENSKQKKRYGLYKCYCGNEFKTITPSVKNGNTKSCGCYKIERTTKHGLKNHRLYQTWHSMIKRCYNKNSKGYENYGGRGITVCDRWLSIENFIEDMYPTYIEGLSIDRIDNNKGYSKDNCRWATKTTQSRNTRMIQSNNKTGYRGVRFVKNSTKVRVTISVKSKKINIGMFDKAIDGAIAYNKYVIENNLEHTINTIDYS